MNFFKSAIEICGKPFTVDFSLKKKPKPMLLIRGEIMIVRSGEDAEQRDFHIVAQGVGDAMGTIYRQLNLLTGEDGPEIALSDREDQKDLWARMYGPLTGADEQEVFGSKMIDAIFPELKEVDHD